MVSIFEKLMDLKKVLKDNNFKIIGKEIYELAQEGIFLKQDELAKKCYVSISTITNFAKYIGHSGYRELIFNLKNEYEHYNVNKFKEKSFELDFFVTVKKWISQNLIFLNSISVIIRKVKRVNIFTSNQAKNAAKYFSSLLLLEGKDVFVFNENNLKINKENKNNNLNLLILSGPSSEILIKNYLSNFSNENYNFLVSGKRQIDKVDCEFDETLIIDFDNDSSHYVYRHLALEIIFLSIFHEL